MGRAVATSQSLSTTTIRHSTHHKSSQRRKTKTMPSRLLAPNAISAATRPSGAQSLTACLARLSIQQTTTTTQHARHVSILASLAPNKGAVKERKRVGRGPSSGHGKTSGRGHKGQGQHGKVNAWFQGGQTPLIVKHGRKGFTNWWV